MLTTLKERLSDLVTRHISSDEFHSATELTGPDIPADIGHFLLQALKRRAGLEARDLLRFSSPWFDFESAPTRQTVIEFITSLAKQAHYPHADFEHTLPRAVSMCCDYLIHPVSTLAAFAVASPDKPYSEQAVRRRAGYFLHYPYILEAVHTYLSSTPIDEVERSRLESHLRRRDEELCASMTAEEWMQLLSPLIVTSKLAFPENGGVPVELITLFMKEKQTDNLVASVGEAGEKTGGFLSTADLDVAIRSVLEPKIEERPCATPGVDLKQGTGSESTNDLPLWKQYARADRGTTSEALSSAAAEPSAEPLWKSYQTGEPPDAGRSPNPSIDAPERTLDPSYVTPERAQPVPVTSSNEPGLLGDAFQHRTRFIRELFDGDEREYLVTIDRLSATRSWQDASDILISDVFQRHQVDIYSETAVAFTNAVENRIKQLT